MIAETLAQFVAGLRWEALPREVVQRATYLILDAVGIALASTTYEFAQRTMKGLLDLEGGNSDVIGFPEKLALRDAVLMNGVLVHGLDFDDTHLTGVVHATASCFPCALGTAAHLKRSGRELLTAYVAGMEVAARVGAVAKGELNQIGFHPTGVVAAFATSLVAGHLQKLEQQQLAMAQGVVLSMASGTREYSSDGAWTKRLHPGWAGAAGITAASLAKAGFVGPRAAYEGRFGLYATHLGRTAEYDIGAATLDLRTKWELLGVAVKPFPVCQYLIASIDAAIALVKEHQIDPLQVADVCVLLPQHAVIEVCEPVAGKRRPTSAYAASFSVQFAVACALLHKKLGLAEIERYGDRDILALADKVEYAVDSLSGYPKHFSSEVVVRMKDGKTFRKREQVNRGAPERPVTDSEIVSKFMDNAQLALSKSRASSIMDMVLNIEKANDSRMISRELSIR
jgi:2-methylcitrate dehydratase PrpD